MCGGTSRRRGTGGLFGGLSPRVRGNPAGVIPPPLPLRVYPRVCGGTHCMSSHAGASIGLSPRVRGNHHALPNMSTSYRSIPACAGEPLRKFKIPFRTGVYPRVCGGTMNAVQERIAIGGLSPRVRGNLVAVSQSETIFGSIPACAGEPIAPVYMSMMSTVYPRVCGGTSANVTGYNHLPGLSPRVRGNRGCGRRWDAYARSIPACAGEPGGESPPV